MVRAAVGAVGRGGGTAPGDQPLVASSGVDWVLAPMRQTSIMKCTKGARGVLLGASGRCVSVSVAVGALGVSVGLDNFFDFAAVRDEEDT